MDNVGTSARRVDGDKFVSGGAAYIDDVNRHGQVHMAFVRSQRAHAKIVDIDATEALEMDGVEYVLTGEEVREETSPKGHWMQGKQRGDEYAVAVDRVRYSGEPVAAVFARDKYLARDAAERIQIDYDPLDPILDPHDALAADAAVIHPEMQDLPSVDGNLSDTVSIRVGDVDAGFDDADHVFEESFTIPSISGAPMEPHGCVADYDTSTDRLVLYTSTQVIQQATSRIAAVLGLPRNRVEVRRPEIGGGFGNKLNIYSHDICASLGSRKLGKPVKAVLTRQEQLEITRRSFEHHIESTMGMTESGDITAWKVRILHDEGAYHSWGRAVLASAGRDFCLPYQVPNLHIDADVIYTNRRPAGPVRGTKQRQLAFAREVLVNKAITELGFDPVAYRREHLLSDDDCPYESAVGDIVSTSGIRKALDKAATTLEYESQKEAVSERPWTGIGVASTFHVSGSRESDADYSSVDLQLDPDGQLTLKTEACEMGTGIRTTLTQVVADVLSVETDAIRVIDDSSEKAPSGLGSWGSRTMTMAGTAAHRSALELREEVERIAAHQLEAHPDDLVFEDGSVHIRGATRETTLAEIASLAYHRGSQLPPGRSAGPIRAQVTFDSGSDDLETPTHVPGADGIGNTTLSHPASCHIAVVSVDPGTGKVTVEEYVICDDVGKAVNPQIVEGQLHGGAIQAVGAALTEEVTHDESTGQPLNSSFSDYGILTAPESPPVDVDYVEVPSPNTPDGWKGMAEGPMIAGPPAIVNAVSDAVGHTFTELPLHPDKVLEAMDEE